MLQQKATVSKKAFFSAEELAKELNVKKFLVKSWEREFRVTPEHPAGGSKCYSQDNLKTFAAIKDLLLNKKMTFSQAKRVLGAREVAAPGQQAAPAKPAASVAEPPAVAQDSTVVAVEAPVLSPAAEGVEASSSESVATEIAKDFEDVGAQEVTITESISMDVAPEATASIDEVQAVPAEASPVQAASVSEDSMVEAVEMEMTTDEVSVASVVQDDLVQPAVMPQAPAVPVHHEEFMQKVRDFKKQLIDFKEQLDLEG